MASNGTPQGYLSNLRPTNNIVNNSMAQDNTTSGNPYGYLPQNYGNVQQQPGGYTGDMQSLGRYQPPTMTNPYSQTWNDAGKNYMLPAGYGPYNNAGYQAPYFNQSPNNPQGGQPGNQMQTVMNYLQMLHGGGNTPGQPTPYQPTFNGQDPSNSLPPQGGGQQNPYTNTAGSASGALGQMPQPAQGQASGLAGMSPGTNAYGGAPSANDTYMQHPVSHISRPRPAFQAGPAQGQAPMTGQASTGSSYLPQTNTAAGPVQQGNAQPEVMNNSPDPAQQLFAGTQTPAQPQPYAPQIPSPAPNRGMQPYLPNLTYGRFGLPMRPQVR